MTQPAIRIQNLGKRYRLGVTHAGSVRELANRIAGRMIGRKPDPAEAPESGEFWALRDVSFDVQPGEVVGIIGKNGAGKSTLLKILSRISSPTEGRVELHGRVASLLEVGTGFHPELTGRENVYLNGTILGMTRREVDRRFDQIVDFAGVDQFIDTPVKRYSSGMKVRLGFAVAAHLEPEILIVDEVLAVGDVGFQRKCLGKLQEVSRNGRTVLFVSHNMAAIKGLCTKAAMFTSGRLLRAGDPLHIVSQYLSDPEEHSVSNRAQITWSSTLAPGCEAVRLCNVSIQNSTGRLQATFTPQDPIRITICYDQLTIMTGLRVVMQVVSVDEQIAFTSTDQRTRRLQEFVPGRYTASTTIPGRLLNVGRYALRIWIGIPGVRQLVAPIDTLSFTVHGIGNHGSIYNNETVWPGVVCPDLDWSVRRHNQ